ncbi:hypothetical protein [Rubellimicrobium aerolatum]|uniref:Uncharacterized protein n=1 Tax=Rubellimicrobium aerolatum TaxID=490979 RepID=A0ABW0S6X3_9RHOB|nr:hypothetical protein [Rubellimicrobium aerolatum]MBP1804542.1 hypothetical protein [Rubellimicrobium aerolatum]
MTVAAPRPVPDLRPAADAEATERITAPPAQLAWGGPAIAPASASQIGWAARSLLDPASAASEAGAPTGEEGEGPKRVLKPYDIPMLPSDDPDRRPAEEARAKVASPPSEPEPEPERARATNGAAQPRRAAPSAPADVADPAPDAPAPDPEEPAPEPGDAERRGAG